MAQDFNFILFRLLAVFAIGGAALAIASAVSPAVRGARANLWTRVATWAAISAGLLTVTWAGGAVLAAASAAIGLLAGRELVSAGRRAFPGAVAFALFFLAASVWVALPLWLLNDLRDRPAGFSLAFSMLMTVAVADIAAMFGGLLAGRHHPFPRISPGKTAEGMLAGLAGGLAMAAALAPGLPAAIWPGAGAYFATSILVVLAGMAGDLAASALKRRAGIKDFGCALPGHGGVMDRLDSLLVALPTGWLAVRCFWP